MTIATVSDSVYILAIPLKKKNATSILKYIEIFLHNGLFPTTLPFS